MKASALAISMILILVPLAGCSGSDTEVTVDMDSEDLQGIIDDNREDFLNNTTVVVFQEYHNNTTVINHNSYSNNTTTNVDESGASTSTTTYNYNGSSDEDIRMFTVQWDPEEHVEDPSDFILTRPFYYDADENGLEEWDYGPDSILGANDALIGNYNISVIYVYPYNGQNVEVEMTCEIMHYIHRIGDWGWEYQQDIWEDFLANNYGYSASELEEAAQHLRWKFDGSPYDYPSYEEHCRSAYTDWITLFEIDLDHGTAMEFLSVEDLTIDINCDDGYGTGIGNHSESYLMGGQANCTVSGSTRVYQQVDAYSNQEYNETTDSYDITIEMELGDYSTHLPLSFAVYFELHPVTVHQ